MNGNKLSYLSKDKEALLSVMFTTLTCSTKLIPLGMMLLVLKARSRIS